jgi:hypothetical protein
MDKEKQILKEKKHCFDCKYCEGWDCTHPYREYCVHSSLWTPKWYQNTSDKKERI